MVAFNTLVKARPPSEGDGIIITTTSHGTTVIDAGPHGVLELPTPLALRLVSSQRAKDAIRQAALKKAG
jgi:hypothetical protein